VNAAKDAITTIYVNAAKDAITTIYVNAAKDAITTMVAAIPETFYREQIL